MAGKGEVPHDIVTAIAQSSERLEDAASILAMLEEKQASNPRPPTLRMPSYAFRLASRHNARLAAAK